MAKVVMFMRDTLTTTERIRNSKFREVVQEFAPYIIEGDVTYAEVCVNTRTGFENVFLRNPDCELVFTIENNSDA